jgi:two-component system OmpR family response regulator
MIPQPTRPAKLLVVDDDRDTRKLIGCIMRGAGYLVWTAGDFEAALELACRERFDLLITDVGMPGRDGCELLTEVSKMYQIRAVVLSGSDADEYRQRCTGVSGVRFLRKPIGVEELLAAASAAAGDGDEACGSAATAAS